MNTNRIQRTRRGAPATVLSAALLAAGLLLSGSAQVNAQDQEDEALTDCTDKAWADYNSCLMESSWWVSRLTCDFEWELQMMECAADEIGEVRGAFQPH